MILQTSRLFARPLQVSDEAKFFELMGNPKVMNPIPQKTFTANESKEKLFALIALEKTSSTKIWALCKKETSEFVGFCGLLKNDLGDDEIAYRLLEHEWGHGYGTEIAKGLIDYCFTTLHSNLVTADVFIENTASIKILEKYFRAQKEFYNEADECIDRRYILKRDDWQIGL